MRRLPALAMAAAVLVLAGCVPGEPSLNTETGEGADAVVQHFLSLSPEAQLAAVADHDTRAERELWTIAGIDDALGGKAAADAAFAEMQAGLAAESAAASDSDTPFTLASFSNVDEATGAGMYAGMTIGDVMNQVGIQDTGGGDGSGGQDLGEAGKATVSQHDGNVATSYDLHTTYKGVQIDLHIESELTPCPDAKGNVHAEGTYSLVVTGPGGTGMAMQIQVQTDITVDDDAKITASTLSYDVGYTDSVTPGAGSLVEFSVADGEMTVHHESGPEDQKFVDEAWKTGLFFAGWMSGSLERAAQKGWESGRCIQLNVSYSDGPSGLDPDDEVTMTVSPIAKSDGAPAGGTVTAKLTSGSKSVSPEGQKVKSDATFTYIAPGEKDKDGTVHLEARSKRGVGLADVTLDTKGAAYLIEGGAGELSFSGQTCDIGKPFSISGKGLTLAFTPSSTAGGAYTLSGVAGVPWTGGGTYSATTTAGGGSLTTTGDYTVHSPVGEFTKSATMNFTLTPLEHCS